MTEEISASKARWAKSELTRGDYARMRREALVERLSKDAWDRAISEAAQAGTPEPRPLVLGYGRCSCCDRDLTCDLLEVDHVNGRNWELQHTSRWARVARYWREYESGVPMRVLCRSCNARLGGGRRYARRRGR